MSIYDHEREKSMHEIEKNQSRIAITTYIWTSQNKKARVYGCNGTLH